MSALGKNKLFPGKKDTSKEEETLCSFNTSGKEALQKATLSCTGPKQFGGENQLTQDRLSVLGGWMLLQEKLGWSESH